MWPSSLCNLTTLLFGLFLKDTGPFIPLCKKGNVFIGTRDIGNTVYIIFKRVGT